ncbi:hypothetical protein C5167_034739 [Papaver somniferum]|uniref:Repressor of RNA polymerase III transcription MAF1 homolog n=1 Tax=Papaver somniferum TaxID=3469 RepID=A0A4Y7KFD2_PAPSO|nr:hypothetical protein C5167_034739 [Papaver somniferum]
MKYLEFTNLDRINQFLNYVSFGEYCIKGSLEAYSCKHTGTDKKLSFSLDQEILDYLGQSADSDPPSPASILSSRSSRKTLIYLVLTLGHMYPDYDFRYLCSSFLLDWEGGYWVMPWSACTATWQPALYPLFPKMGVLSEGLTDGSKNRCSRWS